MAQPNKNHNTRPKSNKDRSKKRRFYGGQKGGPRAKKRKLNYETDLTKSRNLILVSCERYKEKTCGRALKLVFTEYIEEFIKTNLKPTESSKTEDQTPPKQTETEDNAPKEEDSDEDIDLINTNKTETNVDTKEDAKDKKQNEEGDEDDDVKPQDTAKETESTKTAAEDTKPISISDAINNELSTMNANDVCEWIQGPDGLVVVIIFDERVKASKLLEFVFNKTYPSRPNLSPFVYRLFPLDCTSFSRTDEMIALGQQMINQNWDDIAKEDAYAINYKNRGNKSLSKDRSKIVTGIASVVPKEYKVDLKNPKTVILLQTFGRTAGISIIPNGVFAKHKEYNLGNFE
eukprot:232925_1